MSVGILIRDQATGCLKPGRRGGGGAWTSLRDNAAVRVCDGENTTITTARDFEIAANTPDSWVRESVLPIMDADGNIIVQPARKEK